MSDERIGVERAGQRVIRQPKHYALVSPIQLVIVRDIPGDGSGGFVNVERAVRSATYESDLTHVGIRTRYPDRFTEADEEIILSAIGPGCVALDYTAFVWGSGVEEEFWTPVLPRVYVEDTWRVLLWPFTMFFGSLDGTEAIGDCEVQS